MPARKLTVGAYRLYKKYGGKRKARMPFSKQQAKAIKKIAQKSGEMKYSVASLTNSSLTSTSGVSAHSLVGTILQGDGDNERLGDKINVKDLEVRITLKSGTVSDLARVYLYQSMSDLANYGGSLNDLYPQSFWPDMDDTNGNAYKVLFDRVVQLAPDIKENGFLKIRIPARKLGLKYVEFDDTASTIIKGGIFVNIETPNTTVSQMTAQIDSRLRYYD